MTKVLAGSSVDGYVAGPNDRPGTGLGEGGERLHYRVFGGPWTYEGGTSGEPTGDNAAPLEDAVSRMGAVVGGRWTYEAADHWGNENPWGLPFFIELEHVGVRQSPRHIHRLPRQACGSLTSERGGEGGAHSRVHRLGPLVAGETARDVRLRQAELRVGHGERAAEAAHAESIVVDPDAEAPGDRVAEQDIARCQLASRHRRHGRGRYEADAVELASGEQTGVEARDGGGGAVAVDGGDLGRAPRRAVD